MSRRSAKGSVQARVTRAADLESADSGEPTPESAETVFFSEKDIEEGTELVEAVSQSDLPEKLKSSLERFAEKAAGSAVALADAEARAATQQAVIAELQGRLGQGNFQEVKAATVGFSGGVATPNADGAFEAFASESDLSGDDYSPTLGDAGARSETLPTGGRGGAASGGAAAVSGRSKARQDKLAALKKAQLELEAEEEAEVGAVRSARANGVAWRKPVAAAAQVYDILGDEEYLPTGGFAGGEIFGGAEEEEEDDESTVPYISRTAGGARRPRRIFEQQQEGFIEAVNLLERGEYEEVITGWSQLAVPAQYETEYLLPIVGRLYDVQRELERLNRNSPGRIPGGIIEEIGRMHELGRERLEGNIDRARTAAGQKSRGWSLDLALGAMLDQRDARIDRGQFRGAYGRKKKKMSDRIRVHEETYAAKAAFWATRGGNRGQQFRGQGGGNFRGQTGEQQWIAEDAWAADQAAARGGAPAGAAAIRGGRRGGGGRGTGQGGRFRGRGR